MIFFHSQAYKPEEFLVGYEPFDRQNDEFMICITEKGRDDVLKKLGGQKENYLNRINKSKGIVSRPWVSLGSEAEVDDFQVRNKRDLVSDFIVLQLVFLIAYTILNQRKSGAIYS